jgi:hypothetical protein
LKFLFVLLFSVPVWATTFQVQNVDQQLKHADGVFIGHYLKKKFVQLEDGKVATQMVFKMRKEHGLQSELLGMDEVLIHYPGGKWKDQIVEVQGLPEFNPGEHVVIFTKNIDNRYWGLNLGMGTYKIVRYGQDSMMVNSIFPHNPEMGQVKLEEFEKIVRQVKGSSLKVVTVQQYPIEREQEMRKPASQSEGKNRTVAGGSEEGENNPAESGIHPMWLLAFLGMLGASFRLSRQR